MKVLVIGGGISAERDVALRSSQTVYEAVKLAGHDAELYDWDGSNEWLTKHVNSFDVALPILHGKGGEDGQIQTILEHLQIPYVGTDSHASKLCMDKQKTRDLLTKNGVLVPHGEIVSFDGYKNNPLFDKPHVLKPSGGGSSIDTFILPNIEKRNLEEISAAFDNHETLLLEEYIVGIEITAPYLEGHKLPVIEIVPPASGVFDYENKYNGNSSEICPPSHVDGQKQNAAIDLGAQVHKITKCRDLSRTDMILSGNKLYVLEINTMPGMTVQSLFPLSARTAGLSMEQVVDIFINLARSRA